MLANLRLVVGFVLPLSQQQEEQGEQDQTLTKINQKDMSEIWHRN